MTRVGLAAALAAATMGSAAAQSFGDTQLAYQNGVVYDDDLVPGRGLNQPFLVGEESGTAGRWVTDPSFGYGAQTSQNSANLIGPDGRAVRGGR